VIKKKVKIKKLLKKKNNLSKLNFTPLSKNICFYS